METHGPATSRHLSYVDRLEARPPAQVTLLVIHCTELPDLAMARTYAEEIHYRGSRTGNSGHYYVDRDGACEEWVPVDRVAHHVAGLNAASLGIELVNRGRWPHWFLRDYQDPDEPYSTAQIDALVALTAQLRTVLPALEGAAGHEHLDRRRVPASDDPSATVRRKIDPGPLFPWESFLERTGLIFEPDAAVTGGP